MILCVSVTDLLSRPLSFPFAIPGCWFIDLEPYFLPLPFRWSHELADGFEDVLNLFVMPFEAFFQFHQFEGQFLVRCHHLPRSHKYRHNLDIDLDRPLDVQNA